MAATLPRIGALTRYAVHSRDAGRRRRAAWPTREFLATSQPFRFQFRSLAAALCLVLLLLCGTAQAAHFHPHGDASAGPECSLCVAAHLQIHPGPSAAALTHHLAAEAAFVQVGVSVSTHRYQPAYRIRPPPARLPA